ncbi:hypothetical protein ES705_27227 [subsurface metagenome]
MKIGKAIELLVLFSSGSPDIDPDDLSSAQRLGIEALDAIKTLRQSQALGLLSQLPGERNEGHDEN